MAFWKPIIKGADSERHHVLIGAISSGKSSLINQFFGLNEPIGLGEITLEPKIVAQIDKVIIWDLPGIDYDFKISDPEFLALLYCADKVFILNPGSPKDIQYPIKIASIMKPENTYLIRNKIDYGDTDNAIT